MVAGNLEHAIELAAFLADLGAFKNAEKGLLWIVVALQIHQLRVVIAVAFGTRQAKQRGIFHTEYRHDCLEK